MSDQACIDAMCPLASTTEVPYRGNSDAKIIIVGESPGYSEVRYDPPTCFVGRSGRLLAQTIGAVGLSWDNIFMTNAARCLMDKKSLSAREINLTLHSCRPKLKEAIEIIKPEVIIPLGAYAYQQVMNEKAKITQVRGNWVYSEEFDCDVMPAYHPAYVLRNPHYSSTFQGDFEKVLHYCTNGYEIPEDNVLLSWEEVDSIRPLLDGGFPRNPDGVMVTAVDTETQGARWYSPNNITISYQVAASMEEGWTVFLHEECELGEGDFDITIQRGGTQKKPEFEMVGIRRAPDYDRRLAELIELMQRTDIKKYFMNFKFDKHQLYNLGVVECNQCPLDVGLAAHALDSNRFLNVNLGTLMEFFSDLPTSHKDDFSKMEKSDMLNAAKTERERFVKYASTDAVGTLHVALNIIEELKKDPGTLNYYVHFCHPVETEVLWKLERNGVLIDVAKLPQITEEILTERQSRVEQFRLLCPEEVRNQHPGDLFRLTRAKVLHDAMFSYTIANKDGSSEGRDYGFGLTPVDISRKTGKPVFDQKTRQILLESDIPAEAKRLIQTYEEWSQFNTLATRYVGQIQAGLDPAGWLHPTYSITFTGSGRTGARNPSIQNFPKRGENAHFIRKLIIAPPGFVLLHVDHAVSELRWVAEVANENRLLGVFRADGDPHVLTAQEVTGEDMTDTGNVSDFKAKRQKAKPINFGFVYGMSAMGLQNYAQFSYNVSMTQEQAYEWRTRFFDFYSDIIPWHERVKAELRASAVLRHIFGRRRFLPEINSNSRMLRNKAERIGINFTIQGPSSDYTLMGGMETDRHPEFDPSEITTNLFIHDAFAFYVKEDCVDKYWPIVKASMETPDLSPYGRTLKVPFKVDGEVGDNLAELEKVGHE